MSTALHAALWAHRLTLEGPPGTLESLSRSLASARVDLNPHQIDAAVFALQSPLSRGVLLADEVGLGKTIEAGLVLAQRWAERRRRILLIVPATLRKQWQQELADKFGMPARIEDAASFRAARASGRSNPLDDSSAVHICSYQFAAAKQQEVRDVDWDLAVLDEAHRVRNVYRSNAKIATSIKDALTGMPKLLLTATPLQNSLFEIYGLVSFLDEYVFGDVETFREQFVRPQNEQIRNARLRDRLAALSRRTLRRQVREYVRFTQRIPLTQSFAPSDAEQRLYEEVSSYLQREMLHALPSGQRTLLTLVLRKLLASSTFAIAGTLRALVARLVRLELAAEEEVLATAAEDFEGLRPLLDEWSAPVAGPATAPAQPAPEGPPKLTLDHESLRAELEELRRYAGDAEAIEHNAKGDALLRALERAFDKAAALGASRKAVIFTESRRTQAYLCRFLAENGYEGQITWINGTNADPESRAIHARWLERHRGSDRVSGARAADAKAALVEEFEERAAILVATESAAEGVNLQFCSLVVNYDLPWNPQRIEQRIGRCHRYGQRHDVVVVNFLNERNAADQRVFELLDQKFRLFDGVFGASDEILGAVESGVDIERRIADAYQNCRTAEEIEIAFDALQAELEAQINERMQATRDAVLAHLDEDVQRRLQGLEEQAVRTLEGRQRDLWRLARQELADSADFDEGRKCFEVKQGPAAAPRPFFLSWPLADDEDGVFFHPEHELARLLIEQAQARALPVTTLRITYPPGPRRMVLEPHLGHAGVLESARVRIAARHVEEHLVHFGRCDDGEALDDEVVEKLLDLPTVAEAGLPSSDGDQAAVDTLDHLRTTAVDRLLGAAGRRNEDLLRAEEEKLEQWAEDAKAGLERELKDLDREIREARRTAKLAGALAEKLEQQRRLKDLEGRRNRRRRELFDRQDEIESRREQLIADIERQLRLTVEVTPLYRVRFRFEDGRAARS